MALATISKRFDFSSSHQLEGLHAEHPCSRVHGHNYEVTIYITGETDDVGFVIDYRDLSAFKEFLDDTVDHRHLNDLVEWNPTAENIASWLAEELHALLWATTPEAMRRVLELRVSVSETPKTTATVHRHIDAFEAEEHAQQTRLNIDPHEVDADRYRWNFDTDGRDVLRDEEGR